MFEEAYLEKLVNFQGVEKQESDEGQQIQDGGEDKGGKDEATANQQNTDGTYGDDSDAGNEEMEQKKPVIASSENQVEADACLTFIRAPKASFESTVSEFG